LKNCIFAFLIGGLLCCLGQLLFALFSRLGLDEKSAGTLVTVSLIFLSAVLTGIGIFDRIARVAGAGTLVPVTGFANSVVSPAIDNKSEGLILGVGAKIFIVSGPVILYAVLSGTLYGVIYYTVSLFL
jgi:stage V sporulation protein AC